MLQKSEAVEDHKHAVNNVGELEDTLGSTV